MSPATCILSTQFIYCIFGMDVAINSDYLPMHHVLIVLLTDTLCVLRELNLYIFRDNVDTKFSLNTETSFPQLHSSTARFPLPYLYFPNLYLASSLHLLKGRAGIAWEQADRYILLLPTTTTTTTTILIIIIIITK